ncbi:MAG: GTP-binding protein, partial [Candidatus Heimdallarchaeota archaeon]|nr:GTP-binding protein [Candidatus Heimdallarchaeota archaeon]
MSKGTSPINFVILGLENAGKTTLLRNISGKKFTETLTTIGMDVEQLKHKGLTFQAIDVGGQLHFRETLWQYYTTLAKGVIFVFDIFDNSKLLEARKWFDYISHRISQRAVLMFLANKIDLKDKEDKFMSLEEIVKTFKLDNVSMYPERSFRIWEVSAKTGENVDKSISWMFNKLIENIRDDSLISLVLVLNKDNEIIYTTSSNEVESELDSIFKNNVQEMKERGINEKLITVHNISASVIVQDEFSVIIGGKSDGISKEDLVSASLSISQLLNNEFIVSDK